MAAIAGTLFRLSWGGKHYGGETWSNTLHFDSPVTTQPNVAAMDAAMGNFAPLMSAYTTLSWWKYNALVPATGRYAGTDSNTHEVTPPWNGEKAPVLPQATMVVSLHTDASRGPAHSGRIFTPCSLPPAANGQVPADQCNALADAFVTFLKSVVATKTHLPVIWSPKYQQVQPIRTAGVGRVVDTQRSRRRSLIEAPTFFSVTA